MAISPQAQELNNAIVRTHPSLFNLLSPTGVSAYFPKTGIISQSAEAKSADINATIGIALDDSGAPLVFKSLAGLVSLDPKNVFTYAHPLGRPDMRLAWSKALRVKNPGLGDKPISDPIVTCALTHGLSMAGYLFTGEGDTIISPDLYWGNYRLIFSTAYKASIDTFVTFNDKGGFNVDAMRDKLVTAKGPKKIVLLNFPNNPTGYTVTDSEAQAISELLLERAEAGDELLVLCDDAYFGLVFEEGILKESLFARLADLHERILAVKIDGPTKEDYVWGLRVGFMTFGVKNGTRALYDAFEMKLAGAIRGNISNVSHIGQSMLAHVYEDPGYEQEKEGAFKLLERRYRKVRAILAEHSEYVPYFEAVPFNSGYFMCVRLKGVDAETARKKLLSDCSTGVISQNGLLRIAFSSTPYNRLDEVFANIYRVCRELAPEVS